LRFRLLRWTRRPQFNRQCSAALWDLTRLFCRTEGFDGESFKRLGKLPAHADFDGDFDCEQVPTCRPAPGLRPQLASLSADNGIALSG
jgi:hypothetical protein